MKLCHRSVGKRKTKKKVNGKTFRREQVLHRVSFTQSRKSFPLFWVKWKAFDEVSETVHYNPCDFVSLKFNFTNFFEFRGRKQNRKNQQNVISPFSTAGAANCYWKLCDFLSMIHNESPTEYKVCRLSYKILWIPKVFRFR